MTKVSVLSVIPLTPKQQTTLIEALEKKYGQVELVQEIEKSIVGGIKVTIDSKQIDASLSNKIHQLQTLVSSQA